MRVTEIINESKINTEFLDQWFTKNDEFVLEPGESPRRYKGYVKSRPDLEIVLYKEGGKTIGGQPITDRYSKEIVSWGGSYVSDDTYKIIKKKMNSSEEMKKVMESLDKITEGSTKVKRYNDFEKWKKDLAKLNKHYVTDLRGGYVVVGRTSGRDFAQFDKTLNTGYITII